MPNRKLRPSSPLKKRINRLPSPFPEAKITVADFELTYLDSGQGSNPAQQPTLLFVHGFPLDGKMWREQLEPLSKQNRILVPDLRGFGNSTLGSQTMRMELLADDLVAMLDALQITQPVVLCGLSMGGYVAWQFVQRHRQRLCAMILCDTKSAGDTEEAATNREKMAQHVMQRGTSFVAEAMLPKMFAPAAIEERSAGVQLVQQTILNTQPETIAAAQRAMAVRPDVTNQLSAMAVPSLVVVGELDAISPPEEMEAIAKALPQAEFVQIAGAGHMSPLEKPAAFNAAVQDFLNRLVRFHFRCVGIRSAGSSFGTRIL